jgi:hypothetical protein
MTALNGYCDGLIKGVEDFRRSKAEELQGFIAPVIRDLDQLIALSEEALKHCKERVAECEKAEKDTTCRFITWVQELKNRPLPSVVKWNLLPPITLENDTFIHLFPQIKAGFTVKGQFQFDILWFNKLFIYLLFILELYYQPLKFFKI